MAYQSLRELICDIAHSDKDVIGYLEIVIPLLDGEKHRLAARTVRDMFTQDIDSIDSLLQQDLGDVEFVKEVPDRDHDITLLAMDQVEKHEPVEMIQRILEQQQEQLLFFEKLSDVVVYTKSKDICEMMIKYKEGQIKALRRLMESHRLSFR